MEAFARFLGPYGWLLAGLGYLACAAGWYHILFAGKAFYGRGK